MRDFEGILQLFPGRARGAFEIEGKWYMLAWSYDPSPPSISDAIIKVTLKCHGTHELKGTPQMDGSIIMDGSVGPQKLRMWGTPEILLKETCLIHCRRRCRWFVYVQEKIAS
ncbi:hypothetical protein N7474_004616 [Penicillium riverlandense]|uniref:uncharacterized protein n=1 Tax=Penicillium riverlandense TaxID=1903569 RepID=UPI002547F05B|nr:uncharacterized protein N7474_004616 [Penicillium riverlandense]KAJ5819025.1 hypothetical protein N7474_004616 [Penicillium riverlandense]